MAKAKYPQWEVYYRRAVNPEVESCGICRYFQPWEGYEHGNCEIVAGVIYPEDTCDLFEPQQIIKPATAGVAVLGLAALWGLWRAGQR